MRGCLAQRGPSAPAACPLLSASLLPASLPGAIPPPLQEKGELGAALSEWHGVPGRGASRGTHLSALFRWSSSPDCARGWGVLAAPPPCCPFPNAPQVQPAARTAGCPRRGRCRNESRESTRDSPGATQHLSRLPLGSRAGGLPGGFPLPGGPSPASPRVEPLPAVSRGNHRCLSVRRVGLELLLGVWDSRLSWRKSA